MDESQEDQRAPHRLRPNRPVSLPQLRRLGVAYRRVSGGGEPRGRPALRQGPARRDPCAAWRRLRPASTPAGPGRALGGGEQARGGGRPSGLAAGTGRVRAAGAAEPG